VEVGEAIPDVLLDETVGGVNLVPGTLRDQLGDGATLVVFLRQLGCIFCRAMVGALRDASTRNPGYPPVLLFFQGTGTEGRVFLSRSWPEASAVADRPKRFYEAFGVERGGLWEMFGPGVWSARRGARAAGFEQGKTLGDAFMMPGVFWVEDGRVRWRHRFRHAGDAPDFDRIPALVRAEARSA